MVYRIYKDKKLICASEDKYKAFKIMRESFEQGSHYYVETEENGVKEREQYYLAQRADGRVCVNKRSTADENRKKYNKDKTKIFALRVTISTDADIIEQLEKQESISGYLKSLIRTDIKNNNQKE